MKGNYAPLQHESIDKMLAVFQISWQPNNCMEPHLVPMISPGSNGKQVPPISSSGNQQKQELASPQQPSEHQ